MSVEELTIVILQFHFQLPEHKSSFARVTVPTFYQPLFQLHCSIRLNDTSEIGPAALAFPRTPRIAVSVLLSTLNRRRVLT